MQQTDAKVIQLITTNRRFTTSNLNEYQYVFIRIHMHPKNIHTNWLKHYINAYLSYYLSIHAILLNILCECFRCVCMPMCAHNKANYLRVDDRTPRVKYAARQYTRICCACDGDDDDEGKMESWVPCLVHGRLVIIMGHGRKYGSL